MRDFRQLLNTIKRESRIKECFCSNEDCSSKIIKAHSVQNNRILNQLSENGHVLQLKLSDSNNQSSITEEDIGRKIATVSTNFCGFHDSTIFNPIESRDYRKDNYEQEFLFAYRAFAKEYHVKRESKNFCEAAIKRVDSDKRYLLIEALKGTNEILKQLEEEKTDLNKALLESDFRAIKTYTIEFHGRFGVVASSTFAIEYDLRGNKINNLSDLDQYLKFVFLTIIPQKDRTFILISFLRKNQKSFSFIVNQIMRKSITDQKNIISNLILSHVENLIISPKLWSKLLPKDQDKIKHMFHDTIVSSINNLSNLEKINLFLDTNED